MNGPLNAPVDRRTSPDVADASATVPLTTDTEPEEPKPAPRFEVPTVAPVYPVTVLVPAEDVA
jgi:hypothetical protein